MSLNDTIKQDLKLAMKEKNHISLSTLRMLISAIRNKEISMRKGEEAQITDELVLEVLNSEIKKRNDSIEAYDSAGREDLSEIEKNELEILKKYLPEQLSDEEIEEIIKKIVSESGEAAQNNFGRVMGQVMPQVKGKADGKRVTKILKDILG